MGDRTFSEQLTGKDAPDLVYKLMLAEVKILQEMESYTEKRAALDYEYGEKLAKLHEKIKIGESDPHTEGSQVEKAWRTYLTESENKAITIMNNAKNLGGSTQQSIKNLRARKKDTADKFQQQKLKIEAEYLRSNGETDRLQASYQVALKEAGKLKDKLDDLYKKNKSQRDWQKGKERFDDASRKLHMNHNLYFLSIKLLNIHQNHKVYELNPHILDTAQEIETKYLKVWKDIFLEIVDNSSWSREEFMTSENELRQTIDLVSPATEFKHFIAVNKKSKKPLFPHLFDTKLIEDSNATSGLTDDMLAVNDLTHDQLINKKMDLEQDNSIYLDDLVKKKSQLEEENKKLRKMANEDNNNTQYSTILQYSLCQQKLIELKETECKFACTKVQFDSIEDALSRESNPKQPYIDLSPPRPSSSKSNTSLNSTAAGVSNERSDPPERKARSSTLPRTLAKNFRRKSLTSPPKVPVKPRPPSPSVSSDTDGDYDDPESSGGGPKTLAQCDYFHGSVDRSTVTRLLKCDGDFIVREKSGSSADYVLSVLWRGQTKHFILKADDGMYKLEGESFPSIPQLVDHHHQKRSIVQATTGVILVNPIRIAFKPGDGYTYKQTDVRLDQTLGSGHFGEVFKGYLIPLKMPVAIKSCKPKDDVANQKQKFIEEAEIMKPCQHPNLIKLIGVCIDRDPYYILLELCEKGDLLNFLRKESVRLNPQQRIKMANDVANGMSFLERNKIIHRDLAARNCLVKLDMTVKICDFGMSREEEEEGLYTMKETKVIPFKWTAPEVWRYNRYTSKSDVWSFGVTLWEIFSGGKQPYPDKKNHEAKRYVEEGNRLDAPSGTPPSVDELMKLCWLELEQDRPNFQEICRSLKDMRRTKR